jgi:polysaccharide export outer membrane protein
MIFVAYFFVEAQESSEDYNLNLKDQYSLQLPQSTQSLMSIAGMNSSVNEDEYIVDSGDIFLIKIDVPGPAVKVFQSTVTPDGFIFIPDATSLNVRNLNLKLAKQKISKSLFTVNPSADIEVFLFQTHQISINIIGNNDLEGSYPLLATSRLYDAINAALEKRQLNLDTKNLDMKPKLNPQNIKTGDIYLAKEDTLVSDIIERIAFRRIELIRNNQTKSVDLLRFKLLGDLSFNPYLMNADIIRLPIKATDAFSIQVSGAVAKPIQFEFLSGDSLKLALKFAGNILPHADSSNIELYRFDNNKISYQKFILNLNKDSGFPLQPDDRIFVRYSSTFHRKFSVEVIGEVNLPGSYPILEGNTTLSEIIENAGGFTPYASLENARLIRSSVQDNSKEFQRLQTMQINEKTYIEESYYELTNREDLRIIDVDFKTLFITKNETSDIELRNNDLILIPKKKYLVYISGGIDNPGGIAFHDGWNYKDYIKAAGGFGDRARKGNVKIIRSKTGNWIDADESVLIKDGDIIFIPTKREKSNWQTVRDTVATLAQFGAFVAVIYTLSKP